MKNTTGNITEPYNAVGPWARTRGECVFGLRHDSFVEWYSYAYTGQLRCEWAQRWLNKHAGMIPEVPWHGSACCLAWHQPCLRTGRLHTAASWSRCYAPLLRDFLPNRKHSTRLAQLIASPHSTPLHSSFPLLFFTPDSLCPLRSVEWNSAFSIAQPTTVN